MLFKRGRELIEAQRKFSPGDFMSQSAQLVLEIDFYFMCKFGAPEKKYIVFFISMLFCQFFFLTFCLFFSMVIKICTVLELCRMIFFFSGDQDHM